MAIRHCTRLGRLRHRHLLLRCDQVDGLRALREQLGSLTIMRVSEVSAIESKRKRLRRTIDTFHFHHFLGWSIHLCIYHVSEKEYYFCPETYLNTVLHEQVSILVNDHFISSTYPSADDKSAFIRRFIPSMLTHQPMFPWFYQHVNT
jgi:hypothetical protein